MQIIVTLRNVRGESVGIPRLFLDFRAEHAGQHAMGIVRLTAEVYVAPAMNEFEIKKYPFVGCGEVDYRWGQFSVGQKDDWTVNLVLHPHALTAIEKMRNKGDLFLIVQFFCMASNIKDNVSPIGQLERASVYAESHSGHYSSFEVAQSKWIKTLKSLGYGDYFLMEIPLKGVPGTKGMQKAVEHLKVAWEHFEQGNDAETLGSCYKAFEYLAKKNKFAHADQNAFEKILGTIPEEGKRRRLKMLMHDLCQFLTLGRHEPGTEAVMLDEREAEYGLILSQASLSYLAKLMRETAAK
jgi:hypothetical protein